MCSDEISFHFYKENILYRGGIKFHHVAAVRTRAERCCTVWHIEGAYATLVEVIDSLWAKEIYADTSEGWRDKWKMSHFMIYLDSTGCFEVIADSWSEVAKECVK
jgi:hypothetical protein